MWWLLILWFAWLLIYGAIDSVKSSKKEKERIAYEKKMDAEFRRNYDNHHTVNNHAVNHSYNDSTNDQKNNWILVNQGSVKTWENFTKYSYNKKEYVLYNWTVMTREEAIRASADYSSQLHKAHVNKIRDDLLRQEREMYNDQ